MIQDVAPWGVEGIGREEPWEWGEEGHGKDWGLGKG